MTLYDFRRYPRRSIMSRRVADRRKILYSFGTPEWVANIETYYLVWPKSDRRDLNRRTDERREPDRRQQQLSELHRSEQKYSSILLSQEERKLIEDLYFDLA